jgi:hypothetical protein
MVSKELRGLVKLITDLDQALADKDAALRDVNELYGGLLEMLQALTKRHWLTKAQFEHLAHLVVERAIVDRVEAFEERLSQFEAALRSSSRRELPPPPPPHEGDLDDGERQDAS